VEVVAIGPEAPEKNKAAGYPFPVLSDPDLKATADYGLVDPKGWFGRDIPRAATLLVNKGDRNILWLKAAPNIRERPTADEVFEALRK
jgi:peroxiredoxin